MNGIKFDARVPHIVIFVGGMLLLALATVEFMGAINALPSVAHVAMWIALMSAAVLFPVPRRGRGAPATMSCSLEFGALLVFGAPIACWLAVVSRLVGNRKVAWTARTLGDIGRSVASIVAAGRVYLALGGTIGTDHDILYTNCALIADLQADFDTDNIVDACDNCPGDYNAAQLNTDKDNETAQFRLGTGTPPILAGDPQGDACDTDDANDLFSDADERTIFGVAVGSAEERTPCRTGSVVDPWAPDLFPSVSAGGQPNRLVNINDLVAVLGFFGQSFGDGGYLVRFDIFDPGVTININDLVAVLGFFGQSCQPPP